MAHDHNDHHGHSHTHEITSLDKAFILGIVLNMAFVAVEFGAGFWFDSIGLISDAGHNLSDVASLVLAMLAFRLAKVRASRKYTYGYKKSTVLVSLLNAVILLVAVGIIIKESVDKLASPVAVEGGVMAWVAGIGVVINAFTAWLFIKHKDTDLNIKGAYLHMAADALVSVGVAVSGVIILHTGWYVIDPVIGLVIALIIVYSTWSLLRDSLRLSLDGVPAGVDIDKVERVISSAGGVESFHHLHIWPLSTTETALTVHIVVSDIAEMEAIKHTLKHSLEHVGISHATLEFEPAGGCRDGKCAEIEED